MAFASAVTKRANFVEGANGALKVSTSGSSFVDAFTNLNKDSPPEYIDKCINHMIREVESTTDSADRSLKALNVWKLWVHKRHCREGEKEKLMSYRYFLTLYNLYPDTCCLIVKSGLFGDIGYWKDGLLIWGMINVMDMPTMAKYKKYNPLIEAIRESMLSQRSVDLRIIADYVSPNQIRNMDCLSYREFMGSTDKDKPSISRVGEWCVRESSAENKRLFWYIMTDSGSLKIQSHVAYMIRASLVKKDSRGVKVPWPVAEDVPFGAKKAWRKMNSLINEHLGITENRMSANDWDLIDPSGIPAECMKRKSKAILNEKVKTSPASYEEETGNRYPESEMRVGLRKRTREMFHNPEKINAGSLFPHKIAYDSTKTTSTAELEYLFAAWEKKVIDQKEKFEETRAKIGDEVGEMAAAMASGNIVMCADVSASMTWVDKAPNRPIDIAMGLGCFISYIASEKYRDIGFSFTSEPKCFSFVNPGGSRMNVQERMSAISRYSGGSTNYKGLHKAMIEMCVANNVPESELPVLWIGTDGEFDTMDPSIHPGRNYNYSTGRYVDNGMTTSEQVWETTHDTITKMWVSAGYRKVPLMVYHNLAAASNGVQVDQKYKGVILLSGRSEAVLKYILYGEAAEETTKDVIVDGKVVQVKTSSVTPYEIFLKAMDGEHFDKLEEIINSSNEGICQFVE